ncbi:MAG: hypothetical protein C7B43_19780 [Sulfobacillus benefaciens]|uniref:Uncharacterized protein n=1 Tax=Sulfobacillus benefaciens TaxID=453960 RepID=A0A2T2WNL7_9FIRM|nr:MAG: hypothetical protein C7B43_19780 [Sulfobacillus benefaciens]
MVTALRLDLLQYPAWQAQYRKDRHRLKTAAGGRLEPQALASERNMTLAEWVIAACREFGEDL